MITTSNYIFFHNHGDVQHLLGVDNGQPSNVIDVQFGWTPEIEENRFAVMNEMWEAIDSRDGYFPGVSALPSLHYWCSGWTVPPGEDNAEEYIVHPHWEELRVIDMSTPWTWENILAARTEHENNLPGGN